MFSTPHPNVIQADAFSVEVLGRTGLRYTDRHTGQTVRIDSELLAGPAGIAVYLQSTPTWDSPPEQITEDERATIAERIRDAFKYLGYDIDLT